MEIFNEFVKRINESENIKDEAKSIVEGIEVDLDEFKKWCDIVFSEEIDRIDINKIPYIIEAFFRQNNKFKFMVGCMILEATCTELPFITPLESVGIVNEKYNIFMNTLVDVSNRTFSGITDCMYLILLDADPEGKLLDDESKEKLIQGINEKLNILKKGLDENKLTVDDFITLEIIFDVVCFINNQETIELLEKFDTMKLDESSKIFLVKAKAANDIQIDKKIFEDIINVDKNSYSLIRNLSKIKKTKIIPKKLLSQKKIAKSIMIDWLKYPTELGEMPEKIICVDTIENDEFIYYIFKFKHTKKFPNKKWMIGVSGGFEKNILTINSTGHTFSNFHEMEENYKEQAMKMVDSISNYWKNRENS